MGELSAIGISKQKNHNGVLQALFLGLGYKKEAEQLQLPEEHSNERFAWEQIKHSNDYRVIETFSKNYIINL